MTEVISIDLLEAGVYALVGERCRQSYIHELRGGLQSLQTAVELLIRATANPAANSAMADKAAALGRRALQNHEKALAELLSQLVPPKEAPVTVNVGELVAEVLRFIRNDAAAKSVTFSLVSAAGVQVTAETHKLRLILLGLAASLIDAAQSGAVIDVAVARTAADASIEFKSGAPVPSAPAAGSLHHSASAPSLYESLLTLIRRWAPANGARLEAPAGGDLPNALRIYYPLAPS